MILILPTIIILIIPINITAFATDNLINPVLTQWDKINSEYTVINRVANENFNGGYWYQMYIRPEQLDTSTQLYQKYGGVYELGSLDSDSEYNFSLYLLDPTEMGYDISRFLTIFGNGVLFIGLAEYYGIDSNGLPDVRLLENQIVSIDSTNYNRYFGKTININVTPPETFSGSLCLTIQYVSYSENNASVVPLGFANIILNNETQEEQDGFFNRLFQWFENKFKQLFNVLLYLDPNGDENYINPFPINDNDVNGADNLEHLQNGINQFVSSVENLTMYLRVPSQLLTNLGERMPIIPIVVVFTLVGLVVMRLFGVRRDS